MTFEVNDMKTLLDTGLGKIDKTAVSAGTKVDMIESLVETLREQIWELDTTNRNNLVFYGIKEDGNTAEAIVKEIIRRLLSSLSTEHFMSKIVRSGKSASSATCRC